MTDSSERPGDPPEPADTPPGSDFAGGDAAAAGRPSLILVGITLLIAGVAADAVEYFLDPHSTAIYVATAVVTAVGAVLTAVPAMRMHDDVRPPAAETQPPSDRARPDDETAPAPVTG